MTYLDMLAKEAHPQLLYRQADGTDFSYRSSLDSVVEAQRSRLSEALIKQKFDTSRCISQYFWSVSSSLYLIHSTFEV